MARQDTTLLKISPDPIASPSPTETSLIGARRNYNNIQEALAALPEIAGSIEAQTGWTLDLSKVEFLVVTPQELQRRCLDDVSRRTGIPTSIPQAFLAKATANMMLSAHHRSAMAVYLPSERVIVMNEERLTGVSKDSVKSSLHHELTHAAQHQRFPQFVASVDRLTRELKLLSKHGGDVPVDIRHLEVEKLEAQASARGTLLESQALELQRRYEREFDLHPEVKHGPIEAALGLMSMLTLRGPEKIRHGVMAQAVFSKIQDAGTKAVDLLFQEPRWTDALFGKKFPSKRNET